MHEENELLDLVDSKDNVIGTILRKDEFTKPEGTYVRVVNCFVVNSKNQIFIPTRSPDKSLFPNALDFSCGGLVSSGENYEDAMRREIIEELGIKVGKKLHTIGKFGPNTLDSNTFCTLFSFQFDKEINWNRDDFTKARWLTKEDIFKEIKEDTLYKRDLDILLKELN